MSIAKELGARKPARWAIGVIVATILGAVGSSDADDPIQDAYTKAGKISKEIDDSQRGDIRKLHPEDRDKAIRGTEEDIRQLRTVREPLTPVSDAKKWALVPGPKIFYPDRVPDGETRSAAQEALDYIDRLITKASGLLERLEGASYEDRSDLQSQPGTVLSNNEMQKVMLEVVVKSDHPVTLRRLDSNPNFIVDMYAGPRMMIG